MFSSYLENNGLKYTCLILSPLPCSPSAAEHRINAKETHPDKSRNPAEEAIQPQHLHTLSTNGMSFISQKVSNKTKKKKRGFLTSSCLWSYFLKPPVENPALRQPTLRSDWCEVLLVFLFVLNPCNNHICISRYNLNHNQPFFSWRNYYQNIYNTSNMLRC